MAICPECLEHKPWFARRCHACNEEIGFWRQTFMMYLYYTTVVCWGLFAFVSFFKMSFQWQYLGYWLLWILIPFVLLFFIFWIWSLLWD